MKISNLNQRIAFLKHCVKKDNIGNHTPLWVVYFSMWACAKVSKSTEKDEAGVTTEKQTIDFWVRDCSLVKSIETKKYRISFHGDVYNITGIFPDCSKKDYVKITAERCVEHEQKKVSVKE